MSDHETPMVNGVVEHKIGEEVLPFVEDEYGGVIVEMTTPTDPKFFVATLRYSFTQWRSQVCASAISHAHLPLLG